MIIKKLSDLKPWEKNPRKITRQAKAALNSSLKKFGDISGIVYNTRLDCLVCGHQQVQELMALHGDIELKDGKFVARDGEEFAVRCVDWDESMTTAANLAANSPHLMGSFTAQTEVLLKELKADMKAVEFDGLALDKLLSDMRNRHTFDPGEANVTLPLNSETKPGQILELGKHRILCGDALDTEVIKKFLDGKADMIFTDPPYNVDYVPEKAPTGRRAGRVNVLGGIQGDKNFDYDKLLSSLPELVSGSVYICIGYTEYAKMSLRLRELTGRTETCIVWVKERFSFGRKHYHSQYEFILFTWFEKCFWAGRRNITDVWKVERDVASSYLHPTQKPVELARTAIENSCPADGVVLDLFAGSGSTLIAAEQCGVTFRGVEIDPYYCDVIRARWEAYKQRSKT
ncbi:MAG: DNA modification methylase [candidate division Zixibacteria bacterium]|nr:DNA modification methylase [candidate division Zixibacteria bacterium]